MLKFLEKLMFVLDTGRVYKIVHWLDSDGEPWSRLVHIFEAAPGEPIRAMEISKKVSN